MAKKAKREELFRAVMTTCQRLTSLKDKYGPLVRDAKIARDKEIKRLGLDRICCV